MARIMPPHYCGCLSAYYEGNESAGGDKKKEVNKEGGSAAWDSALQAHKKTLLPDVP